MEIAFCTPPSANPVDNPKLMSKIKINSSKTCPVATRGPTFHPFRGVSERIAADTGPGETTAPMETAKARTKIAGSEESGMKTYNPKLQ
jgi:hypothetical protein